MKSGSNRQASSSRVVNEITDWLNNSVGAIMFFNARSAVLQTISAINFIDLKSNHDPEISYELMLKKIDELVRLLNVKVYQSNHELLTISNITQVRKMLKGD